MEGLQAPFPYFGGKSRVALEVWRRFGDPKNYIEPFCGSCAVLFGRPNEPRVETINDMDGLLTNFWRAVRAEPDAVADLMNWPVNEIDLEARHKWLCAQPAKDEFQNAMKNDPDLYDVKRAAWWCWGICQWIGAGWCGGEWFGEGRADNHGSGVCNGAAKLPYLGSAGMGVHRKLPHLGNAGVGVHRQRPHLGDAGRGVHRQLPHLGDAGMGECERRGLVLRDWMNALADRLRNVRICCGDWNRVCGSTATTTGHGLTAVFLDPPYSKDAGRCNDIYKHEDLSVAHDVRDWCLSHGADPLMRIALCGYDGEGHECLENEGWSVFAWKTMGGYAKLHKDGNGKVNQHRERIWFSPHCLPAKNENEESEMLDFQEAPL